MKDSIAAPKDLWLKTPYANLVRYVPSGIYFSRIRVRGKLIRRSLKTDTLAVAKLRLGDLEKVERQRIEIQGAASSGNMRFGEALAVFRGRLVNDNSLKPRTKEFRGERIAALLHSWRGLDQTEVRKITKQDCLAWASDYSVKASPPCVNTCVATLRMTMSSVAKAHKRKDGTGVFVIVRNELALQPGLAVWEAFHDPKDGKVKLDGETVIEFPKLPDFQQITIKVLRWEERDKQLVIKDAELVT
jgi:hypothetical protein